MAITPQELSTILVSNPALRIARENRPQPPQKPKQPKSPPKLETRSQQPAGLKPLCFTVPIPPSLNDAYPTYWEKGKMRRRATEAVKDFKDSVSIVVQVERTKTQWNYTSGTRFSLAISLRFGNAHRRDISNCVKVLEDAISETLGFDDSAIDRLYVERASVNDVSPGADVTLAVIELDAR